MSFFQNPFSEDWRGVWVLGDRHHQPTFLCPRNAGRGDELVISWEDEPFDLSGNDSDANASDTLNIRFAIFPEFRRWAQLSVDITTDAASVAAVTHAEIVTALTNNTQFSGWFTASNNVENGRTQIRSRRDSTELRYYIENGQAEEALRFNARSGVSELPTYMDRHKVIHFMTAAEIDSFPDNMNQLIPLDPDANTVDANVIDNAQNAFGNLLGLDSSTVQEDWELLNGRSGLFEFTRQVSGTGPDAEERIVFPAGAKVGDLATRIVVDGDGHVYQIPHTLVSADLVTPP